MGKRRVLITGGAGFIGSNAAARYIRRGADVVILDNLSREKSVMNLEWLKKQGEFKFFKANVEDTAALKSILEERFDIVLHLAAQVAVTTSIAYPIDDFRVNALGTLLLLEAIWRTRQDPIFIFSSTNKVYGSLENLDPIEEEKKYRFADRRVGIAEDYPIDFHSPYGCSKGCADQYVRDYARIYSLRTVVLRQSCIYGPRQFGIEDQGWVAWFIIACLASKPITIYGNGKQVRDVLYISDLLDCFDKVVENIDAAKGQIYNIGGGFSNQISPLQLIDFMIELGYKPQYRHSEWRQGDQKIYISDIFKARAELGWMPQFPLKEGLIKLSDWIKEGLQ